MLNLLDFLKKHPEQFKQYKVNDLLFVEYHCIIEEVEVGFWTPNNYLQYVLTGKKQWRDLGKIYTGQPNDALFFKKGAYIAHQFFEVEFCSLMIFLPDDFIKKVVHKHRILTRKPKSDISGDSVICLNIDDSLSMYFQTILSYFARETTPPKELLTVKFEELIINILTDNNNRALAHYFSRVGSNANISIREVMESNFTYNLKLEEFARLTGRSLSTFQRDFKQIYNIPPGKWLTQKRLQYGKYLLESTEKPIAEITFDSGFEHSSHFCRSFKNRFGMTPLQFRNMQVSIPD